MKIVVIDTGGSGTQNAFNQISKELANIGHEAIFIDNNINYTNERLGSLDEVVKIQNEKIAKEIFEIKALPELEEFYNPSFNASNRKTRRKAEKEAKKGKKK